MPELPEVENVKEKLNKLILNKTIEKVDVFVDRIIRTPEVEKFSNILTNKTIKNMNRLGKHLIFEFDDFFIVSHLRMEGKYFFYETKEPISKHDHVIFHFTDGSQLRYNDVRKFGTMDLVLDVNQVSSVAELGLEPMNPNLDSNYLLQKFKKITKPIKNSLLDQTIIAGLGNIYVDEVLFYSGIFPTRKTNTITEKEADLICIASKEIIEKAIKFGGSTIRSYNSLGETGEMQDFHKIYGKNNTPCVNCNTLISKTKISGRGTHYCSNCQN